MIIPGYIERDIFKGCSRQLWSDIQPYENILDSDDRLVSTLTQLRNIDKLVFSIACAELLVAEHCGDGVDFHEPWDFIEACWVHEICHEYDIPEEPEGHRWEGVKKGPVLLSLLTIVNTAYGFDESNAEIDAGFADAVLRTFCGENDKYILWRTELVRRLSQFSRILDWDERLPREAVDFRVSVDEVIKRREILIEENLQILVDHSNIFLNHL